MVSLGFNCGCGNYIYGLFKLKVSRIGVLIIGVLMALVGIVLDGYYEHSLLVSFH